MPENNETNHDATPWTPSLMSEREYLAKRTDWAALRARQHAVGSLPPAENIDRAQVAALGSAGPAAGTSVDLDQLAAEIVERAEAYSLDGFAMKGRVELWAFVAGRLRRIVSERDAGVRAVGFWLDRCLEAETRLRYLTEAVRRWHAGAPSWNAEDDLYREMLQLAGVESGTPAGAPVAAEWAVCNRCVLTFNPDGNRHPKTRLWGCPHCGETYDEAELDDLETVVNTSGCASDFDGATTTRPPAGPPVAPAGAGLDVERLVEALYHLVSFGEFKDIDLLRAYRTGYTAEVTAGKIARDPRMPYLAGFRALVLAALGLDATTTTRPQADPSEETQDVE